jgi:potassium efflux system protein
MIHLGVRWLDRRGSWAFIAGLLVLLAVATAAPAQVNSTAGAQAEQAGSATEPLDYDAWETTASEADSLLADPEASAIKLEQARLKIAAVRVRFLAAQNTNASRIDTIRTQLEALGPVPEEGQGEDATIAKRRSELNTELAQLQAPAIKATETYTQADGLIREIDQLLRERQAEALTRLWPAPINPANWPAALTALTSTLESIWQEAARNWDDETKRTAIFKNLPPVIGLLAVAAFLILRGRGLIEGFALRLQERSSTRGRELWAFLTSLGQVIVPTLGVLAFATAIVKLGILGPLGDVVAESLPAIGFGIFAARWLGEQAFPKVSGTTSPLKLSADIRTQGRITTWSLGLVLGLEALREVLLPSQNMSEQAAGVLAFPMVLMAGILLFRLGQILRINALEDKTTGEVSGFSARLIGIAGRVAIVIAVLGPLLAAVGYVSAGTGMVYPAVVSLALISVLFILQRLTAILYGLILRRDDTAGDALVPVLIGFCLTLAALPLFALIWGARFADLTEVFTKFREGFQLGQTRISPTDFLVLAMVFGFGFLLTRLFQGALKSSILPKTSLDQGGQNAIVAVIGYVGISLAALAGIDAAGIDLSGLAIVAGALSVGIGFGLQNIVSNFVSGIILLIERPVSEGDWIEVGGVHGTVKSISVRSTRIQTFDRTDVIVPNAELISGMVTNWTRYNLAGRLIVKIGVAYGSDTRKVEKILQEIAEAQPLAVLNPPPSVLLIGFGADSLDFEIRIILRDVNFSLAVQSDINHEIVRRFTQEGIEIPFAQRDIWLRNPEVLRSTPLEKAPEVAPKATGPAQPRPATLTKDEAIGDDPA